MQNSLIAKTQIEINVPTAKVWDALVNPEMIKQYMFGTNAVSDWKEGAPIVWKGEWQGKPCQRTPHFSEGRVSTGNTPPPTVSQLTSHQGRP